MNALDGSAAQGATFASLFWVFLAVVAVMYVLVIGFLVVAIRRRRTEGVADGEAAMSTLFRGWVALIAVGLVGLALASFFTDRRDAALDATHGLQLTVTANQWWWDVEYQNRDASKTMRTANEIHLPVGIPAHLILKSTDVIHSLWVPNLAGKQDLIPGRVNDITLTPTRVGLYRGECAEFCGAEHSKMALDVVVEPVADFKRWWLAQLAPAPPPATPMALAGFQYVTTRECASCHAVGGTDAASRFGPDLTHVASRRSLAAGALPMSRASLYAWVADPQSQKPGNHMPVIGLEPEQLHAVVAYLETLK